MTSLNQNAYEDFLRDQVRKHSHAVTITLKNDCSSELLLNRRIRLEATIRHLLHRIARMCYGNRQKRYGLCINAVTVIESGYYLARLHAHLALACPNGMADDQFQATVLLAVKRCHSLGTQCVIKRITDDAGWASYMAKDGSEAFSPQCSQRAKP